MPAAQNPFFIRTAEQTESDDQFLNLFGLSVLDLLPEDGSWNRYLSIESPPGSGKSTLLRLFTPTILTHIYNARNRNEFNDLYTNLSKMNAIDARGVRLLGVLVNCREDYSRLAALPFDPDTLPTLFKGLLQSRLALLTLRAALQLAGQEYPFDIDSVRLEPRTDSIYRRPDARMIEGRALFERARMLEAHIVNLLNSFAPRPPSARDGLPFDDFFQLLNTHRVLVAGERAPEHLLIMFDDAHFLESSQRNWLVEELQRHDQSAFASWMAMRLRALQPEELISDEAVTTGREEHKPMRFDGSSPKHIEKWVLDVGDRRAKRAQWDVSSFAACLADSLEVEFDEAHLTSIASAEREAAHRLGRPHGSLYIDWLAKTDDAVASLQPFDSAVRWSQLQILMQRRIRRIQAEFNFGPLQPIDVKQAATGTLEPAMILMSQRHRLPYLYGATTIAKLSSANVEQFLQLSAILFERLINSGNLRRGHLDPLVPSEQHRLIMIQSRSYIRGLRTTLPYGEHVSNLIVAIATLCREESLKPNVPITPGVTGVSLQVSERDKLVKAALSSDDHAVQLLNALSSAIAHNALTLTNTDRQRDEDRIILYLNRLVCPAFDLPLGFGGYKPKKLADLSQWIFTGESSPQKLFDIR